MATDHIRYDVLARDALRGVLRRVLTDAAEHGLPGEHHFITFLSTADGVKLSPRLFVHMSGRNDHHSPTPVSGPHGDRGFVLKLACRSAAFPSGCLVPFNSIKSFFDPSVQFGLQFETTDTAAESPAASCPQRRRPPLSPR